MLIYMILRTVKYRIVGSAIAMRLCWYSYYIVSPLLGFHITYPPSYLSYLLHT